MVYLDEDANGELLDDYLAEEDRLAEAVFLIGSTIWSPGLLALSPLLHCLFAHL